MLSSLQSIEKTKVNILLFVILDANDCHNLGEFSNLRYEDMDFPDGTGGALPLFYTYIALVVLPVSFRWEERLHKGCHEKVCSRVR